VPSALRAEVVSRVVPGNKLVDHEVTQLGRFVVLLRGVNVGKGNKVPMAGFRAALEDLGCTSVQTLLNSGNAVFSSASRSPVELATIVNHNPIVPPESDNSRFLVAFAMDRARLQELAALEPLLQPSERLAVTEHAAYLHCAGGLLESKAGEAILGKLGRRITTRNWGTTLKLASLLGGSAS
jgi:uncharacterized protein (DUF1697 family)